jgi:hypothetical protein
MEGKSSTFEGPTPAGHQRQGGGERTGQSLYLTRLDEVLRIHDILVRIRIADPYI